MYAEDLAGFKPDRLKRNSGNFGIAQVAVFEGAIFETGSVKIEIGKIAADKHARIEFADFKIKRLQVLESLVSKEGHWMIEMLNYGSPANLKLKIMISKSLRIPFSDRLTDQADDQVFIFAG